MTIPQALAIVRYGVTIGQHPVSFGDGRHYTCICEAGLMLSSSARRQAIQTRAAQWVGGRLIPPEFRGLTWDTFPPDAAREPAIKHCREFVRDWKSDRSLLLLGVPSVGKTGLGYCILRDLSSRVPVLLIEEPTLLELVRSSYDPDSRVHGDVTRSIVAFPLLILDDLGASRLTEWGEERLYLVVNGRYVQQRSTVFISNLPLNDTEQDGQFILGLSSKLSERIFARIMRMVGEDGIIVVKGRKLRYRGQR